MEFNKSLGKSVVFMVVLPCIDVGFHGSKKDFESLSKTRAKSFSVQGDCILSCKLTFFVHLPDIFCQAEVILGINYFASCFFSSASQYWRHASMFAEMFSSF